MAVLERVRARNVDGGGLIYFSSARLEVLEWTFQQFIEREPARTCSRALTTAHKESSRVTGSKCLFAVQIHSHRAELTSH